MQPESTVYGYIRDIGGEERGYRQRINQKVTASLPETDEFTFLNKGMFSLSRKASFGGGEDAYLIPFGACYAGIEYEWSNWLSTFETLLCKMYWVSAVVNLETELNGKHSFSWELPCGEHRPGEAIDSAKVEWVHDRIL